MKKIILLLSLVATVFISYSQNATLALQLAKGEKYKISINNKVIVRNESQGQENNIYLNNNTNQFIEVIEVTNENITLKVVNDGNVGSINLTGDEFKFNTKKDEGDFKGIKLPDFVKQAAGFTYELVMNTKGELVSTKGFEKLKKEKDSDESMTLQAMGISFLNVSDSGMINLTLAAFRYMGKGEVKLGDNWVETNTIGNERVNFTNEVTDINSDNIIISKTGKSKTSSKQSIPEGEVSIDAELDSKSIIMISAINGIVSSVKQTDEIKTVSTFDKMNNKKMNNKKMNGKKVNSLITSKIETKVVKQ
jgi:hypothetical protein